MAQDYVTVFQDEMGNQGSDTTVLVKNVFNLRYDIWESFIRDAMLQGTLKVTHELLDRLVAPVISDYGNNLLHHFSYHHLAQLEEIL